MANRLMGTFMTAGLGVGLMYFLDPERGAARRARTRDGLTRAMNKTADAVDATSKDLGNRARGMRASFQSWKHGEQMSDEVLAERVRAVIGRCVGHPKAIEVSVAQGRAALSGPILAHEVSGLIRRVASVRGIAGVEDRLEAHQEAGTVPALQGAPATRRGAFGLLEAEWNPGTRVTAGGTGLVLVGYGFGRRGLWGLLLAATGATLLARALTNLELTRLIGVGAGRRAVDLHKTITIQAPVERVFEQWSDPERFPQFMKHVREVRRTGDARWHWTVAGPAGAPIEFDTVRTVHEPNRTLAWRTEGDTPVRHAGIIRFRPNDDGSTVVSVRMSYNPVAGAVGHALASVFGANPKQRMDDDLMRMKTFIETGTPAHDAAATTRH